MLGQLLLTMLVCMVLVQNITKMYCSLIIMIKWLKHILTETKVYYENTVLQNNAPHSGQISEYTQQLGLS